MVLGVGSLNSHPRREPCMSSSKSLGLMGLLAGACAVASSTCAIAAAAPRHVDTLIKGGTIYSGGEGAAFVGDVAILGDKIVYVGPSAAISADHVVAARGLIVAPGLIDAHSHPDTYIRSKDARQRWNAPWLTQGVSTIVIGVDGIGNPEVASEAGQLAASGIGTNIVPFVGFGAVRQRVLHDEARPPSPAELQEMKGLVAKAMCEGATGLSTGLFYAPQSFATTEEVIAVTREVGLRGGMYDTHQRDESTYTVGLLASVGEAIRIGREAGTPVHFAHLKALGVDVQGQAPEIIALIDQARASGVDVTADQYPWLASGSSLEAALVPRWAVDGGVEAMFHRFDDPASLARIQSEMRENLRRRGGPESILLTSADRAWTGKTLAAVATEWSVTPEDAAIRILRYHPPGQVASTTPRVVQNGDNGSIASFNMSDPDVDLIMKQPWVVTSSDGSDGHPRQYATFPQKYSVYVRARHVIDTANFIRHSTGLTADIYKLDRRGYLKAGYFADVLILDPDAYRPRADYVHPKVLSVGVKALWVNGRLSVEDSQVTGAAAGRALLRSPPPAGCASS